MQAEQLGNERDQWSWPGQRTVLTEIAKQASKVGESQSQPVGCWSSYYEEAVPGEENFLGVCEKAGDACWGEKVSEETEVKSLKGQSVGCIAHVGGNHTWEGQVWGPKHWMCTRFQSLGWVRVARMLEDASVLQTGPSLPSKELRNKSRSGREKQQGHTASSHGSWEKRDSTDRAAEKAGWPQGSESSCEATSRRWRKLIEKEVSLLRGMEQDRKVWERKEMAASGQGHRMSWRWQWG